MSHSPIFGEKALTSGQECCNRLVSLPEQISSILVSGLAILSKFQLMGVPW